MTLGRHTAPGLAAALAALCTTGVATAHGDTTDPLPAQSKYVALGSSYAAGPGLQPTVDGPCARSGADYPHLVADRHRLSLVDVTCSGATTADILTRSQPVSGGAVPPQIDAVTPDTRLVTITIGGNDLDYVGALTADSCVTALTTGVPIAGAALASVCNRAAGTATDRSDYDRVRSSIADVVHAVRDRAPRATVVLVDYLPVFDAQATACDLVPVTPEQARTLRATYDGLLTATAQAAASTGATLAITATDDPAHTPCGPEPWLTGFELPNPAAGKGIPYHPTAAGMTAVADSVTEVL
jgi:lysophospholipase L1-like esterase